MTKLTATAVVAFALVGLSACSSEKKAIDNATPTESIDVSLPEGVTIPDSFPTADTLPGGVTLPGDVTIPGGSDITVPGGGTIPGGSGSQTLPESCLAYLQAISGALSGDPDSLETLENGFDDLAEEVPEDLRDDVEILADGYALIAEKLRGGADPSTLFSDPEIQALFVDVEFAQASGNVSTWLNNECGQDS